MVPWEPSGPFATKMAKLHLIYLHQQQWPLIPNTLGWHSPNHPHPQDMVDCRCPVFTSPTSTEASLGCNYPQSSRPDSRQSCHWFWEEYSFSSGLTFVACSRVRRLTDLLFDPPFSIVPFSFRWWISLPVSHYRYHQLSLSMTTATAH